MLIVTPNQNEFYSFTYFTILIQTIQCLIRRKNNEIHVSSVFNAFILLYMTFPKIEQCEKLDVSFVDNDQERKVNMMYISFALDATQVLKKKCTCTSFFSFFLFEGTCLHLSIEH